MQRYNLQADFKPAGDQQQAIDILTAGLNAKIKNQTMLGVTGSGKTFTMANIIKNVQKPTLILAHNKTLAAQLYSEFKEFFPDTSVEYFVSYYDYYQPEAYIPRRDLYIAKESTLNETIERYRNAATQSLLSNRPTVIIASVSCIYGLGDPDDYLELSLDLKIGEEYRRNKLLIHLNDMQYTRSEYDFYSGLFRVRGDILDIYLASEEIALRIEYFGEEIEALKLINPVTGEVTEKLDEFKIFPAKHFVTPFESLKMVIPQIREDLVKEVAEFKSRGKDIEAHRLNERVNFDLEMLEEVGYCSGIENYSRYIDRRRPGTAPSTLIDYFPDDWLLFVDESHISLPQVRGMHKGDKARKENLVNYGFRLRAAMDNRPLTFEEFRTKMNQVIYVSATPNDYEIDLSAKSATTTIQKLEKDLSNESKQEDPVLNKEYKGLVEQLIRPTGLLDPIIDVRPPLSDKAEKLKQNLETNGYTYMSIFEKDFKPENQIDDLLKEIQNVVKNKQRVLVTTLTKRMAEDLSQFLEEIGILVQYIHSDVDTVERVEILRDLRLGKYDVLVGVNLLREGLDLPEVSLVAIIDADKEGFLRSKGSLIQIVGRAARHEKGRVIMYAEKVTGSMKIAIDETMRRRKLQEEYNTKHGITPKSIQKEIKTMLVGEKKEKVKKEQLSLFRQAEGYPAMTPKEQKKLLREIETQMLIYSDMLEFEKAAEMRDLQNQLKNN